MTLTINISPELEERLQAEATHWGVTAADYIRMLLEERLLTRQKESFWVTATKEEWICAFDEWMDSHDANLPPLPDEATSRESFYGDRG